MEHSSARQPSARQIAEKAKSVRLLENRAVRGKKDGKSAVFIPADTRKLAREEDYAGGQVLGVLETELEGDETGLPPGRHNLYLCRVGKEWCVFAESEGKITGQALRVEMTKHKIGEHPGKKATFNPEGWCICHCLAWWGPWCIWAICYCW